MPRLERPDQRSRKRRRPDAASWNSRSICGVNQTAATRSASSACARTGWPSRRKTRRSELPSGSLPVPMSKSPCGVAKRPAMAQGRAASSARRPSSPIRAPRRPRPGPRREIASSRFVLPAPFSPAMATMGAVKATSRDGQERKSVRRRRVRRSIRCEKSIGGGEPPPSPLPSLSGRIAAGDARGVRHASASARTAPRASPCRARWWARRRRRRGTPPRRRSGS